MSERDVQNMRAGYEAFSRGDTDWLSKFLHPDFRYRSREELPGGGEYEGRRAFDQRLAELTELFADINFEPKEFLESGPYVLVTVGWSAIGRGGGVRIAQELVHVWRMQDGHALGLQVFSDKATALEAVVVGLSE